MQELILRHQRMKQKMYAHEMGKLGVKNIAIVVNDDEQVKAFHKELDNTLNMVKLRYGMVLRFFSKVSDARTRVNIPTIVIPPSSSFRYS
jgi:alpha-D-ribose 1-methylphosphonate 5-phosphate C-P lyase